MDAPVSGSKGIQTGRGDGKERFFLPILGNSASGSTTHTVTRISRIRPSSYQAPLGKAAEHGLISSTI